MSAECHLQKCSKKKKCVAKTKAYSSVENNTFIRVELIISHIKMIKWLTQRETSLEGTKRKLEEGCLNSLLKKHHHFVCGNETRGICTWDTQDSPWMLLITGDSQNSVWGWNRDEGILTPSPDYGKKRGPLVLIISFLSQNVEKITSESCPGLPKGHKFRIGDDSRRQWILSLLIRIP